MKKIKVEWCIYDPVNKKIFDYIRGDVSGKDALIFSEFGNLYFSKTKERALEKMRLFKPTDIIISGKKKVTLNDLVIKKIKIETTYTI